VSPFCKEAGVKIVKSSGRIELRGLVSQYCDKRLFGEQTLKIAFPSEK
jgi:hypothetical protein